MFNSILDHARPFRCLAHALGPMQDGHARILAVLQSVRISTLPNIRSMSERVPAFRKPSSWFGFFGPAGLPAPIVARLNGDSLTI